MSNYRPDCTFSVHALFLDNEKNIEYFYRVRILAHGILQTLVGSDEVNLKLSNPELNLTKIASKRLIESSSKIEPNASGFTSMEQTQDMRRLN